MGVWQGVAMDSLKFHLGLTLSSSMPYGWALRPFRGSPPQGRQPAAVFYPFGHLMPYTYDFGSNRSSGQGEMLVFQMDFISKK
jgi:hypothetical protein